MWLFSGHKLKRSFSISRGRWHGRPSYCNFTRRVYIIYIKINIKLKSTNVNKYLRCARSGGSTFRPGICGWIKRRVFATTKKTTFHGRLNVKRQVKSGLSFRKLYSWVAQVYDGALWELIMPSVNSWILFLRYINSLFDILTMRENSWHLSADVKELLWIWFLITNNRFIIICKCQNWWRVIIKIWDEIHKLQIKPRLKSQINCSKN